MTIREIRHFIDLCMAGDVTLDARYQLLADEEQAVVKQIKMLQEQLDFLHYKMWYFKTAVEAGTEKIHYTKVGESYRVAPDIQEQYQKELAKCHDIGELINLENNGE